MASRSSDSSFSVLFNFSRLNSLISRSSTIAVRPFNDNTLTLGIDLESKSNQAKYMPFFELCLGGGVSLKSSFTFDSFDNISSDNITSSVILDINFGKGGFYVTNPNIAQTNNFYKNWGFGYQQSSQRKKTIFNTPKDNQKKYVRLSLDGLFIEEKPGKQPFNFNMK